MSATVLDKEGGFVEGLDPGRFAVFEDGKRQRIDLFSHEDTPVSVGVIIAWIRDTRRDIDELPLEHAEH